MVASTEMQEKERAKVVEILAALDPLGGTDGAAGRLAVRIMGQYCLWRDDEQERNGRPADALDAGLTVVAFMLADLLRSTTRKHAHVSTLARATLAMSVHIRKIIVESEKIGKDPAIILADHLVVLKGMADIARMAQEETGSTARQDVQGLVQREVAGNA